MRQEKLILAGAAGVERMDYPGVVVAGVEDCPGGGCFGVRNWSHEL